MKKKICNTKRIKGILVTICLFFIFLTGCGASDKITENTIAIDKDGKIVQTIVEDFPSDTYDVEELKQMNEEEVKEYNDKIGIENIVIKDTKVTGNKITVVMQYKGFNDYYEYNREPLYVGTIEQAKTAGYDVDIPLLSAKDQTALTQDDLNELGEKHIAIINEEVAVRTSGNILYVSEGVTYVDKKLATVSGEKTAYIVFK